MKRIVIWCNGTWNTASADYSTNVQMGAQSVKLADGKIQQLNIYLEGVGTSHLVNEWLETRLAGAFGLGLFEKIAEAYRHIVFNYEPGDEIFIFGFSRGAYTARSLAGLLRKCGIVKKANAKQIRDAFEFYKDPDVRPSSDLAQQFRMEHSPEVITKESDREWRVAHGLSPEDAEKLSLICIKYLGVWDTVGALGVPQHLVVSKLFNTNRKYAFHDTELSSSVKSARHAVAVDEDRLSFTPSLWSNLDILNANHPMVPFQQKWFPGDHGSIGGGGDIVGLSNVAFRWIIEGAQQQGLKFDEDMLAYFADLENPVAPLKNISKQTGFFDNIYRRAPRNGPQRLEELSDSTLLRLELEAKAEGWSPYRPKTLEAIHKNLPVFARPSSVKRPLTSIETQKGGENCGEEEEQRSNQRSRSVGGVKSSA